MKRCWKDFHIQGCRKGRPRCREMRRLATGRGPCICPAYHFPHRFGSGVCGNPMLMNDLVWGPAPDEDSLRRRQ